MRLVRFFVRNREDDVAEFLWVNPERVEAVASYDEGYSTEIHLKGTSVKVKHPPEGVVRMLTEPEGE